MPSINPFITDSNGQSVVFTPSVQTLQNEAVTPGASQTSGGKPAMNVGAISQTQTNAAGTSENVAVHVASFIAISLLGVYGLRKLGFRFAVAGGIG